MCIHFGHFRTGHFSFVPEFLLNFICSQTKQEDEDTCTRKINIFCCYFSAVTCNSSVNLTGIFTMLLVKVAEFALYKACQICFELPLKLFEKKVKVVVQPSPR